MTTRNLPLPSAEVQNRAAHLPEMLPWPRRKLDPPRPGAPRRAKARPAPASRALTPAGLLQLGLGFWGPRAFLNAVELGLFTALTAAEIMVIADK